MPDGEAIRRHTRPVAEPIGWVEPEDAFLCFADEPELAFFDSARPDAARGRWSYLAPRPARVLRIEAGGVLRCDGVRQDADPLAVLRRELAQWPPGVGPAPWCGGAAGFLSYEFGAQLLPVPRAPGGSGALPDAQIGFYDTVLAFDHATHSAWLRAPDARARAAVLERLSDAPAMAVRVSPGLVWRIGVGRAEHMARVARVIGLIEAGDIYQANLALWAEADLPEGVTLPGLYLALRRGVPAPFAAYVGCGQGRAVLSASPERFVRLDAEGVAETRPIKGTRPRGRTEKEDARLAQSLLQSAKDRAENLMIVDLMRNDLSRVASEVRVPSLCALESYSHVHHLVSAVTGRLLPGRDSADLLRAAFPGGSITGAPKIRAMEVIAALEGRARGPYCGSAFWMGPDGAMDSSILIRTLSVADGRVVGQAGGGIVAESDPAAEFEEAMVKLRPLLESTGRLV